MAYSHRARTLQLNDGWLDFARQGKVAAFANQQQPEVRNKFWTAPEVEIDLAASTGVTVRLGFALLPRAWYTW